VHDVNVYVIEIEVVPVVVNSGLVNVRVSDILNVKLRIGVIVLVIVVGVLKTSVSVRLLTVTV